MRSIPPAWSFLASILLAACVSEPFASSEATSLDGGADDATSDASMNDASVAVDAAVDAARSADAAVHADATSSWDGGSCYPQPNGVLSFFTADDETKDRGAAHNDLAWAGNGSPAFAAAKVGHGFSLANSELVRLAPTGLDALTGLTVEGWIRPTMVDGGSAPNDGFIVERSTLAAGFSVWLKAGVLRIELGAPPVVALYSHAIQAEVFTHFAVTFSVTPDNQELVRVYVNGQLDAEKRVLSDAGATAIPSAGDLRLGAHLGDRPTFAGLIDELTIYDHALPTEQIADIVKADTFGKCR
jgi:hypothetical protein